MVSGVNSRTEFDGAQNGAADGLGRESRVLKQIEDMIVGIVARRADLLDDDLLFAGQLVLFEQRILQDIAEDIGGQHHVFLEHAGEIAGVLDRGRGVEVAADIFDGFGNLQRGARSSCP